MAFRSMRCSAGTKSQRGPDVVDSDLSNRLYAALRQECRERVPIQVGAQLLRLWIRHPRQTIRRRSRDDQRASILESRRTDNEYQQRLFHRAADIGH